MENPPNVVALPLEEARDVLARAGWVCREVVETRAPRRSREASSTVAGSAGRPLVVRLQVIEAGAVRLTVAVP